MEGQGRPVRVRFVEARGGPRGWSARPYTRGVHRFNVVLHVNYKDTRYYLASYLNSSE